MGEGLNSIFMIPNALMRTMVGRKVKLLPMQKNMVLPLPESESDI